MRSPYYDEDYNDEDKEHDGGKDENDDEGGGRGAKKALRIISRSKNTIVDL